MLKFVAPVLLAVALLLVATPKVPSSVRALGWVERGVDGQYRYLNRCTTFSINQKKHYWLTAGHCARRSVHLLIDRETAYVVVINSTLDIAVLVTPTHQEVPALKLQQQPPWYGEEVKEIGYPLGSVTPATVYGVVYLNALIEDMVYLITTAQIEFGYSGGPILNGNDEIVGMVLAKVGEKGGKTPQITGGTVYETLREFTQPYWE